MLLQRGMPDWLDLWRRLAEGAAPRAAPVAVTVPSPASAAPLMLEVACALADMALQAVRG